MREKVIVVRDEKEERELVKRDDRKERENYREKR